MMHAMSPTKGTFTIVLLGFARFIQGQLECKITVNGFNYFGLKNETVSGRICQDWSSQYPHKHKQTDKIVLRNARNYCRNPDGEQGGPWCYTIDRNKRWEYCNIPVCPLTDDGCYEEGKGYSYLGKINVTETGYACRRWDSEGVYVYRVFEHLENYCRSPDGAPFPWCLSTNPDKRWEKCQIPICGGTATSKSTSAKEITTTTTKITRDTLQHTSASKFETELSNNKDKLKTSDNNCEKCKEISYTVEIVTMVTLGCVLGTVVGIIYIIIILRQNRLHSFPSQRPNHADKNVYDARLSDLQPIVHSRF